MNAQIQTCFEKSIMSQLTSETLVWLRRMKMCLNGVGKRKLNLFVHELELEKVSELDLSNVINDKLIV